MATKATPGLGPHLRSSRSEYPGVETRALYFISPLGDTPNAKV